MIRVFPKLLVCVILVASFSAVLAGHHKAGVIHAKIKPLDQVVEERKFKNLEQLRLEENELRLEERISRLEESSSTTQAGKIIVIYKFKCAGFARQQDALRALDAMIKHEQEAAAVTYTSSPLVFEDGQIGAVDRHESVESYNDAVKWQGTNAVWQTHLNKILKSCGISSKDIQTTVAQIQ